MLTRAFGVPAVLAGELAGVPGIVSALVFESWAARHAGEGGVGPAGDIDVLVLGDPDRDALYEAAGQAERQLRRAVQVTVRDAPWLEAGSGAFHGTVTNRPMLKLALPPSAAGPIGLAASKCARAASKRSSRPGR